MSFLPAVRERLRGAEVPGVKQVRGAVQLNAALALLQFDADAYVLQRNKTPAPNSLVNAVQQRLTVRLAVLTVTRYANSRTGEEQADEIEIKSDAVVAALLGWSPDATRLQPLTYAGGAPLDGGDDVALWVDEFETSYLIRSV